MNVIQNKNYAKNVIPMNFVERNRYVVTIHVMMVLLKPIVLKVNYVMEVIIVLIMNVKNVKQMMIVTVKIMKYASTNYVKMVKMELPVLIMIIINV